MERQHAVKKVLENISKDYRNEWKGHHSEFGRYVFDSKKMKERLPKEICDNITKAKDGLETLNLKYADTIAKALKEWAVEMGVNHYSHWFLPMTGASAEKQEAFVDWKTPGTLIDKFSGNDLIQGEPDASSFPSGGLRSTFEARGYTGWDASTYPFIWKSGGGPILCIPSVFYSWTNVALDSKIPLLRSDEKIGTAAKRLLNLAKKPKKSVFSTLGWEQEFFIVDQALYALRPDLVALGMTVFGAPPPKGQELSDHYFAAVKDRISAYMGHFENAARELGIPVKTRHNEVAPGQHEIAPIFEKASISCDHNIIAMELMRQIAKQRGLYCLLTEKPFAELNGSGKHNNWSLMTNDNVNLLDPTENPENQLEFLILLTAILHGVHRHESLLRETVASFGNDFRLGGHEAPPAIMSIFLGEELEAVLDSIENNSNNLKKQKESADLKIPLFPNLPKHSSDRNRTSPFAFTGNKFEFRAVGSEANCAWPITVINAIVSESLNEILDDVEKALPKKRLAPTKELYSVLRKYLKKSRDIRFSGDNYSKEWEKEAKKRSLTNIKKSVDAFKVLLEPKTKKVLSGILSEEELKSRYDIFVERYADQANIYVNLSIEIFKTKVMPAALKSSSNLSDFLIKSQALSQKSNVYTLKSYKELCTLIEEGQKVCRMLESSQEQANMKKGAQRASFFSTKTLKSQERLKEIVNELETLVDDEFWTLPKYSELLFLNG